jgi:hypothetical protein
LSIEDPSNLMQAHGLIGQDEDAGCFGVVVQCHAISRARSLLHSYVNFHRLAGDAQKASAA